MLKSLSLGEVRWKGGMKGKERNPQVSGCQEPRDNVFFKTKIRILKRRNDQTMRKEDWSGN